MLSALVEHGHDYVDTSCLTCDSADNTLKISVVIIGAHGYGLTVHFISNAVIENVTNDENVVTAYRSVKVTLTFAGSESGAVSLYNEGLVSASPFFKIVVNSRGEFLASAHSDNAEISEKFSFHVGVQSFHRGINSPYT